MTSDWEEPTDAFPGTRDDQSFELDVQSDEGGSYAFPAEQDISFVVFEPSPVGLTQALTKLRFTSRARTTGSDVMALLAEGGVTALFCAPTAESERRRLMCAAVRLRFPNIPILFVTPHAKEPQAHVGALRDGASGVLPWPLPARDVLIDRLRTMSEDNAATRAMPAEAMEPSPTVARTAPTQLQRSAPRVPSDPFAPSSHASIPGRRAIVEAEVAPRAESTGENFSDAVVVVQRPGRRKAEDASDTVHRGPARAKEPSVFQHTPDTDNSTSGPNAPAHPPRALTRPARMDLLSSAPTSPPSMNAVAQTEPLRLSSHPPRGDDITALVRAISPFIWSLKEASDWVRTAAEDGDPFARTHAKTLDALTQLLRQLEERIKER